MRTFLFSCIFFCWFTAFADISRQQAHDFATRFVEIGRSNGGIEKLNALIVEGRGTNQQMNRQTGWWEYFRASIASTNLEDDLNKLEVNRILIREPDLDNPMQIQLTDDELARYLVPPEKIAVIYFANGQKDARGVLIMSLISDHGTIRLCPMVVERGTVQSATPAGNVTKEIPFKKNLSPVPGVEIVKIADDNNSYGFPPPKTDEKGAKTFGTNPLGCILRQTILYTIDEGTWVKGLDHLPSGRFWIHCELSADESESVKKKLLDAIASTFDLNIKMDDHYAWQGYKVSPPNFLPDCFRITKEAVGQSAMHGIGNYEAYSLKELISHALHNKPFDLLSTNDANRYDVHLEVWPEAYGEMAALEQLGFQITQANLQRKTLIINTR